MQPMRSARAWRLGAERERTQPVRAKTGGSTYQSTGHKAWQLIDEAGCRGLTHGAAQVSEKHCNFLINTAMLRRRHRNRARTFAPA